MACRQARIRSGKPVDPLSDTAALATYVHGLAADLQVEEVGTDRITALDVMATLPKAMATLARLEPGQRLASDRIWWI
jgi:NAD(P)H-hydrate repair Nnr-like enzyme with NAD(P)H-hydrate dehydratase domain